MGLTGRIHTDGGGPGDLVRRTPALMSDTTPSNPGPPRPAALVIGGGCAGLAAAVRLAERGVAVTLIETRKKLGGRATSFSDPSTGELVDNCQHVLMRCCTNLLDLYRRLGVEDKVQWHRTLYFLDDAGHRDVLTADDMPAPLHLARPLLAMKGYTWREKLAIARGMLAILQVGDDRHELANMTFAEWLRELDQPPGALEKFWSVVVVSACNETIDRVGAAFALRVFQEGFLATDEGYEMGIAGVPLVELYDPAQGAIESAGGSVRLGVSAERFDFDGRRVVGLRTDEDEKLTADAYVCTVPFDRLGKLCTDLMFASDDRLRRLDDFDVSPIIGIHLTLRRADGEPAMLLPHAAFTRSPLQWSFRKSHTPAGGTYLHAVISAAREWVDRPADQIVSMAVYELRRHLPEAVDAELVHARVVKEKRATFAARPGIDRIRPPASGQVANLFLAGDWCNNGWPATMEGAVRSGYHAAGAAMDLLRPDAAPHRLVVPDLKPTRLYRFLSG